MSQLFASGGQSIGVLASTSVLPMNTQDCSPLGWTGLDWLDLLDVQGTIKSLLQHHSSKASILRRSAFFTKKAVATHSSVHVWRIPGMAEPGGLPSTGSHRVGHDWSDLAAVAAAFFMVQLSHPYMTTGKTTALTRQTFVDKVMSLLFNMLST